MAKPKGTPVCLYCGKPLPPYSGSGPRRKYCKNSHRQRAFEERRFHELLEKAERKGRMSRSRERTD